MPGLSRSRSLGATTQRDRERTAAGYRDKGATKNLRDKVAELQAALDKTRGDLETARKEKDVVDTRLKETNSKLERAQNDLDEAKKSERQTRDQLAQVQESKASQGWKVTVTRNSSSCAPKLHN